jgi:hypothetical protein
MFTDHEMLPMEECNTISKFKPFWISLIKKKHLILELIINDSFDKKSKFVSAQSIAKLLIL